jgi:hypothetical protein
MSIPGSVYIINPQSGKALDVEGAGTANSSKGQLYEQNRTVAQKWVIASDGSIINPSWINPSLHDQTWTHGATGRSRTPMTSLRSRMGRTSYYYRYYHGFSMSTRYMI